LKVIIPTLKTGAMFIMSSSVAEDCDSPIVDLIDSKHLDGTPLFKKINWIMV